MKRPNSKAHLDAAIQRLAAAKTYDSLFIEIRTLVANVVVGQLLPDCVIKGGSALKLRYGRRQTRFTLDFDAASRMERKSFIEAMRENLANGWCDFTGTMDIERPAKPKGVPPEYVMQPFTIHLDFCAKAWCSVRFELGHDEIGDADMAELAPAAPDIVEVFRELGFPDPLPIPLMPLKFQLAQKLHGLSEPGSTRVRDLVDLQLIMGNSKIDLAEAREVCQRLFAYRKRQPWPPKVAISDGWDIQYQAQKYNLPILPSVDEAVAWANDLIQRIDEAKAALD